jgi:hypothetical protein
MLPMAAITVICFGKHLNDASLPNLSSHDWTLLHRFTQAADGTIDFLNRVLFTPPTVPDAAAHATWADVTGSIRNYRDPIPLLNLSVQNL